MTKGPCIIATLCVVNLTLMSAAVCAENSVDWSKAARTFTKMKDVAQDKYSLQYPKLKVRGEGWVNQVGKCRFMDKSTKYGRHCYKVVLKKKGPNKVVLYYPGSMREKLVTLSKAEKLKFEGCQGVDIKDWGRWVTQTCDVKDTSPAIPVTPTEAKTNDKPKASKSVEWKKLAKKFRGLMAIEQERFQASFPGTLLSGRGRIASVGKCGFLDNSHKYGRDCYKVKLEAKKERIVLYFAISDHSKQANLRKKRRYKFKDCVGVSIKDWGFWAAIRCDM